MVDDARDSNSQGVGRGHGVQSWSADVGSGGSSVGGVSKKKKEFVAPVCSCGAYVILFESSTPSNPNRFSLGANISRYFAWLDDYVACLHQGEVANIEEVADPMKRIEDRIASLEMMVMVLESKKGKRDGDVTNKRGIVLFLLGIAFSYCWRHWFGHGNEMY
ncbi:hypothetical protein PIB30_079780 [Stylosanthes scabra]|uniref:Uncharacterized protein n=1 Tax=Stylosanthes scabra TaxID=79078 RepID=A0ABU6VR33_9FABA|nr:hypothetical protein [Stylosanthes scabra]